MKHISLLALCLALCVALAAKPVSSERADRAARVFWSQHDRNPRDLVLTPTCLKGINLYCSSTGRGFVLLSTDDAITPILAYSLTSPFAADRLPANVSAWMAGYERHIAAGMPETPSVSAEWGALDHTVGRAPDTRQIPAGTRSVSPLLTSTWNQYPLYNDSCPIGWSELDTCYEHSVVGCVATATAQVMRYWGHPARGTGRHSYYYDYYDSNSRLSVNFASAAYDWANMPDSLTASSTAAEVRAVAQLCYHVGVAVEMGYSPDGSGAYIIDYGYGYASAEDALKRYFGYSKKLTGIDSYYYDYDEWVDELKEELDRARPVIYAAADTNDAGGHAFVLDGYDAQDRFHVNWGWGGYCDGYYAIGHLDPEQDSVGRGYYFNYNNEALIGVRPDSAGVGLAAVSDTHFDVWTEGLAAVVSIPDDSPLSGSAAANTVEIIDLQGRTILRHTQTAPQAQYTLPQAGVYIVRVAGHHRKIVVE